jgi:pimeloyl-ACP methyl ester carboxylesterase
MGSQNQKKPVAPGQMVDIGGFRLHALVSGQGTPTVVLEPGLGGFGQMFTHIQEAVAAFTRVVAYDRAGMGWSDDSPNPRTPANLAGELQALLGRLDLQPRYILVGHSFGGLLVRFYAGFHPEKVAGVVLVDSSDVQQYDTFPNMDKVISQAALGVGLQKFAARLGLAKLLTRLSLGKSAKVLSQTDLDLFTTVASRPKHQESMLSEFAYHRAYFGPQSEAPRTLGDTPLVIVTAKNSVSGRGKFGGMTIDQLNEKHQKWQKDLTLLSSQGEQRVIAGATHLSILTRPEYTAQVVDAIRSLVEGPRKGVADGDR